MNMRITKVTKDGKNTSARVTSSFEEAEFFVNSKLVEAFKCIGVSELRVTMNNGRRIYLQHSNSAVGLS